MKLKQLAPGDLDAVQALFDTCFGQDPYYLQLFQGQKMPEKMSVSFSDSIAFCIEHGCCIGVDNEGELIAFLLTFNYSNTRNASAADFLNIFGADSFEHLPFRTGFHAKIASLEGNSIYLLSLAVAPCYQKKGLAAGLVDEIIKRYPGCNIVSDVSNGNSLPMYLKRGFQMEKIDDGYFFVWKTPSKTNHAPISNEVDLFLPDTKLLDENGIPYQITKAERYLPGISSTVSFGISCFVEAADSISKSFLVRLTYEDLLNYQKAINVSQYTERHRADGLIYTLDLPYRQKPLLNDVLDEMVKNRSAEWSIVPDVYISIPIEYSDASKLKAECPDGAAKELLRYLDFRTYYEAGVPSKLERVDDLAGVKERIMRTYLGKFRIQIAGEPTLEDYERDMINIGPPAYVDFYVAIDKFSNCGVLTLYSLSSPFLISHLLDNVIRNQITICGDTKCVNIFDFFKTEYGIIKQGTPKSYVVIPKKKDCLSPGQLASLLSSETIYPEGENFGRIVDPEIVSIVSSPTGMGQYDRAFVCASSNVVLEFSDGLIGTLNSRINEESITLFYIELILFEEAAIHIADREIIRVTTSTAEIDPVEFLKHVDAIYDNYSKTIDFWNIKVNYPTSQKSVSMLRTAFGTPELLDCLKRNQEHLQTVFDTKCDIIDRKDAKRMDTSLAIISFLAIFSAWIDGHDYIATWSDLLSDRLIYVIQRLLFIAIFIIAVYALTHFFGNKFALIVKNRRIKKQHRKKHWPKRDRH